MKAIDMKKIIASLLIALTAFGFYSCGSSTKMTDEEKAQIASLVQQSINTLDMTFDITEIYRSSADIVYTNKEYSIILNNKTVNTRLPFWGRSYTGGFAELSGNTSIILNNAPMERIGIDGSAYQKDGCYKLSFQAKDKDNNILYFFIFKIYDDATADIRISSNKKATMQFRGKLDFSDKK